MTGMHTCGAKEHYSREPVGSSFRAPLALSEHHLDVLSATDTPLALIFIKGRLVRPPVLSLVGCQVLRIARRFRLIAVSVTRFTSLTTRARALAKRCIIELKTVSRRAWVHRSHRPFGSPCPAHRGLPNQAPVCHSGGMGLTHVTAIVSNPANPKASWEGLFLVDTGAIDCLVPRNHLESLGFVPEAQRTYELADGSELVMDVAVARVEFMGEVVGVTVIFGAKDTEPILGVTALESVGIQVDPRTQRLKRLPAVSLKGQTGV